MKRHEFFKDLDIPNILTLSRIVSIPLLVFLFYLPWESCRWISVGVFLTACFTDFLDGYIARKMQRTSLIGQFLDPIADKLLISSILMLLIAFGHIGLWSIIPAIVILCREILVSGLREFMSQMDATQLPVTSLAKWKTALQMIAITLLMVGHAGNIYIQALGEITLWAAAILTIMTGYEYLAVFLKKIRD